MAAESMYHELVAAAACAAIKQGLERHERANFHVTLEEGDGMGNPMVAVIHHDSIPQTRWRVTITEEEQ